MNFPRAFEWLEPQRWFALATLAMLPGLSGSPLPLRIATAAAVGVALVLGPRAGPAVWSAITALLIAGIAVDPLASPNHQFASTGAALAVALSATLSATSGRAVLADSSRLLLAAIMGFAALHKLIAPGFAAGAFFHFLILEGGLAGWALESLIPGLGDAVAHNRAALDSFLWTQPSVASSVALLDPWPPLRSLAIGFAWLTLAIEAVVAALLLSRPRAATTHALVLAFAWSVFALRQESVFLAVVCALGLAACPSGLLPIRRSYVASIVALSSLGLLGVSAPA